MSGTQILDDSHLSIQYSPIEAWASEYVCENCRGSENGVGERVRGSVWNQTWKTALGSSGGSSNISLEFQGTSAMAFFVLFTRVPGTTNDDLPRENVGNIAFYLNETRVDPSPIQFDYWWYADFPQEDFLPDLILLAQENLGTWTHSLRIEYTINLEQGEPQVLLAFDRLEYTPVFQSGGGGANTARSSSSDLTGPSATPSESTPAPSRSSDSSDTTVPSTLDTPKILGLSIGLSVLAILLSAFLFWLFRRNARRRGHNATLRSAHQSHPGTPSEDDSDYPVLSPFHENGTSLSPNLFDHPYRGARSTDTSLTPSMEFGSPIVQGNSSTGLGILLKDRSNIGLVDGGRTHVPPHTIPTSSTSAGRHRGSNNENEKGRQSRVLWVSNASARNIEVSQQGNHPHSTAAPVRIQSTRPPSYTSEPR